MGQALALSRFRAARTGDTCVVRGAADLARPTVLLLVIECNGSGKWLLLPVRVLIVLSALQPPEEERPSWPNPVAHSGTIWEIWKSHQNWRSKANGQEPKRQAEFRSFTHSPYILKKKKKKRLFTERAEDHITRILQSTQICWVIIRVQERRVRRTERFRYLMHPE